MEDGAGADESDQVRRVDGAPAGLNGLNQVVGHRQSGSARSWPLCHLESQTYCGKGTFDQFRGAKVHPIIGRVLVELQQHVGVVDDLGHRLGVLGAHPRASPRPSGGRGPMRRLPAAAHPAQRGRNHPVCPWRGQGIDQEHAKPLNEKSFTDDPLFPHRHRGGRAKRLSRATLRYHPSLRSPPRQPSRAGDVTTEGADRRSGAGGRLSASQAYGSPLLTTLLVQLCAVGHRRR